MVVAGEGDHHSHSSHSLHSSLDSIAVMVSLYHCIAFEKVVPSDTVIDVQGEIAVFPRQ